MIDHITNQRIPAELPELPSMRVSDTTLLCAIDYAIGRRTYVVDAVCRDIMHNAIRLSTTDRSTIIRRINDAWAIDALGDADDRDKWVEAMHRLLNLNDEAAA